MTKLENEFKLTNTKNQIYAAIVGKARLSWNMTVYLKATLNMETKYYGTNLFVDSNRKRMRING